MTRENALVSKAQANTETRERLLSELIKAVEASGGVVNVTRDRGDILQSDQNKSSKIEVSSTGTGLKSQTKMPRDLRDVTFLAPEE